MSTENPKTFHERYDRFYLLIGHCIAAWSRVDERLFRVFSECMGPYEQAAIVYYRVPGLDARLGLVDEIVKSVLPKRPRKSGAHHHPYVKQWTKLIGEIKDRLLPIRRRIAHHSVEIKYIQNALLLFLRPDLLGDDLLRIQASAHERTREKERDISPLMLDDLGKHLKAIEDVVEQLEMFRERLMAHLRISREQEFSAKPFGRSNDGKSGRRKKEIIFPKNEGVFQDYVKLGPPVI